MPKIIEQIDLRTDKIEDENVRDSFQATEEYLQGQVLLQGLWKFYELDFDVAVTNFKHPHALRFTPTDIICTGVQGDQRVTFNFDQFDGTSLDITVSGPVKLRFFAGRYEDNRGNLIVETHPTISGGAASTDHSILSNLSADDHLQYLTEVRHDALPADNPHNVTVSQAIAADAGTDITPAELENLSDGSNADALHSHTFPTVGEVVKVMDCDISVAVDDWVFQSAGTNNLAVEATDNSGAEPIVGIVKSKPTGITCEVLMVGLHSLVTGGRGVLRLSSTGTAGFTVESTGFLQVLGVSFGDGIILVKPESQRLQRA